MNLDVAVLLQIGSVVFAGGLIVHQVRGLDRSLEKLEGTVVQLMRDVTTVDRELKERLGRLDRRLVRIEERVPGYIGSRRQQENDENGEEAQR